MTNCPNCGAPYALNSRVCEYCGTARESAQEQEQRDNIDPCTGAYIRHEFSGLSVYIDTSDPSQQIACGTQAIANAASNMTCNLQQAQINIEQAQLNAAQSAQYNNIKISVGSNNSIVNSKIGVNNRVAVNAGSGTMMFMGDVNGVKDISVTHNVCEIDGEYEALKKSITSKQRFVYMICLSMLTLFLPTMSIVCSMLVSRSTSIVGKILGGFLLPLWYSLSYVIALRGLKRHDGAR